jgi:hypothetical protein
MPPKAKTPAPIDRPLSKAYLRQFTGWSTAFPPGVSEPNSLRLMENVMVNRDGSCRIRPGLKYLNYSVAPTPSVTGVPAHITTPHVGTHEPFFTNDGNKAYLYAVRETDLTVGFRVWAGQDDGSFEIQTLTEAGFTWEGTQTETETNFTANTVYVKYVQIDNKIFALPTVASGAAGESMRMFSVGNTKKVQRLYSIERPAWDNDDKLTVVHPEEPWIASGEPIATRRNLVTNPSFEESTGFWQSNSDYTASSRSIDVGGESGGYAAKLSSKFERRNILPRPLNNVAGGTGLAGWTAHPTNVHSISVQGDYMRIRIPTGTADEKGWVTSPEMDVTGGSRYIIGLAVDEAATNNMAKISLNVKYYKSNGDQIGSGSTEVDSFIGVNSGGRKYSDNFVVPDNAATMELLVIAHRDTPSGVSTVDIKDITVTLNSEDSTPAALDGGMGADYYWEGTTNNSPSVYHPAKEVSIISDEISVSPSQDYYLSAYARAGTTGRNFFVRVKTYNSSGTLLATTSGTPTADVAGSWTRESVAVTTGATAAKMKVILVIEDVERESAGIKEEHYVDSVLLEKDNALNAYFSGATADAVGFDREWAGDAHDSQSIEYEYAGAIGTPAAEVPTANTLIKSTAADNTNSFAFFYTFSNEVGESAASRTTTVRVQRPWSSWKWETANASGEPSGTPTRVAELCADQLVAYMPSDVFEDALAFGAVAWTLYMFTWSDDDAYPVNAIRVARIGLDASSTHGEQGWARVTPEQSGISASLAPIPTEGTLINASYPSHGGQGIVAADRMVMVLDPNEQAVIRFSSNIQGSYYDFSPSKGGGFKTLTSGNLYVPACVKLWQNPQSVDTLTILMLGVDGMSTAYYMQPAQIASQTESVNIMAFEETTATPGTTSPFGCEVMNNSLYHPLDDQLMKSTASNYNINHLSVTDKIADRWRKLVHKENIVSSQHDSRIYYLVHNPDGEGLEEGCMGNEVWVFDGAAKNGTWSRWLTQGVSLRKIEVDGVIHMSLIKPDGIYYFDHDSSTDDYVDTTLTEVASRNITWRMETNTQGANRAHDAWAQLQQANLVVGFFEGRLRYGIRGYDLNGKVQDISKIVIAPATPDDTTLSAGEVMGDAWDLEDFLLIRRIMKEWFFYAESTETVVDVTDHSAGQISLVQYRYTPSTVNTGYEFGSVETFEYGRAGNDLPDRTTDSGTPISYIDTGRP